jgi:hypothetical protein
MVTMLIMLGSREAYTTVAHAVPQVFTTIPNPFAIKFDSNATHAASPSSVGANLDESDYPDVRFWREHSWKAFNKQSKDSTTVD